MPVINADCIEHMNTMPPESVDSIVTDPPYHLTSIVKRFGKEGSAPAQFGTDGAYARASKGFMGKEWDGGDIAFRTEVWEAALRVAKPGAYLLAFGGTRTFHRMAVAIEDAGWEIRDTLMWVYGCLSEDTEILTRNGWERFHISTDGSTTMDKEILVYDIQTDVYKWERPKRWTHYSVQQDIAYRIQSDYTDQIVSRGHRCLVERGGKLTFVAADELASLEYMPTLPNDFSRIPETYEYLLQPEMQRVLPGHRTSLATITPTEYTGLIFCPTVSTGAFVARRNGKIFITGNSGFPKSHNVGKGIDKAAGVEREVVGKVAGMGKQNPEWNGTAQGRAENSFKPEYNATAPATDAAAQWDGWGTALKPAWEPIIMARKPLDGTVAANVLKHGTGAMNIDGCRVVGEDIPINRLESWSGFGQEIRPDYDQEINRKGRWPANLIHDGSDEVEKLFPQTGKSTGGRIGKKEMRNVTNVPAGEYKAGDPGYGDTGSAARFFYCAKANKTDRNEGCDELADNLNTHSTYGIHSDAGLEWNGRNPENRSRTTKNNHPTVKPTELMKYLTRLVTQPGGIVLDPFCGSGSTGKGAILEGFQFIGIEKDPEYCEIANLRIKACETETLQEDQSDNNELDNDHQLSLFK